MERVPGQKMHGFTVQESAPLPEIDGTAHTLLHERSGARLLWLENEDVNKSFSIAFKTPPRDDSGVFHILEHSVLCGSRKFPVKEPFVNLLKSSMQTFLNAMTFPDKTMYPVASTNDQDLMNLTDVYLDAVFHPNITAKRAIFEQEGWHYELREEDGQARLAYNGVVFNEMKGALSDPSSVLYDALQAALFPDTPYAYESGGTPQGIPELSYEEYLAEHARHYRTDNSYIQLYGAVDAERMLAFLDEAYLTPVAAEQAAQERLTPRELTVQAPVVAMDVRRPMQTAPENACMALGFVVGHARDHVRVVGADILLDAIAGSNEAPLKRALLDAGLADDVGAYLADGLQQPFAVVELRGLTAGARERFEPLVRETLQELADGGLDRGLVEASLSRAEFVMRERDLGVADGVALSMTSLSGWLYDDELATTYLRYEQDFAELRAGLDEGWFEELIRTAFLESDHKAQVEVVPVETEAEAHDGIDEEARLVQAASAMDEDELAQVAAQEAELRRLQTEPDPPEALATLPQLHVSDIAQAPDEPETLVIDDGPTTCLLHRIPTHNIAYAYRYFDLGRVAFEDLPYVGVLTRVLGKLGTDRHSAAELDTLVNGRLGNLSFFAEVYGDEEDPTLIAPKLVVGASALSENLDALCDLPREIMLGTDFSDVEKIRDVLQQVRLGMEQGFATAGHSYAMARVASYVMPSGVLSAQLTGVDFYRFVKGLLEDFDEQAPALTKRLADVAARLFRDEGLTVSFTGSDEDWGAFRARDAGATGVRGDGEHRLAIPAPQVHNEAFIVPTDVCFAALGADRRSLNAPYSGLWQVAARALSYDHLWNEVRVKGGAYGAGFQAPRTGAMRFYSYRDPHLDETLERFAASASWLRDFSPDEASMEGFVVSSVAAFDKPLKARALARREDARYFGARPADSRRQTRDEMLAATPEAVAGLAGAVEALVEQNAACVFGSRDILESSKAGFTVIDLLNE